jgi:hypothetical protein
MIRHVLLATLLFSTEARAQTETLIKAYEYGGDTTFIDISSIQTVGTSKRYWVVTKLAAPDQYRVVLRRTFVELDCNARMEAQRAFVDYDAQGSVVASDSSLDRPAHWRPIVPGSNGDLSRAIVCDH